jgi:hypothetical protein
VWRLGKEKKRWSVVILEMGKRDAAGATVSKCSIFAGA